MQRHDGRIHNQLRIINLEKNKFGYAPGSVLLELGNTKVLCSVTIQTGVPSFLRGKKTGWLSAEYAMLPSATQVRTHRVMSNGQRNGRSVEISRLIGRSLRTIINLDVLSDRTITIDCDVLQADGGTRTACLSGAYAALKLAQNAWLRSGLIDQLFLRDTLAAVSVGVLDGKCILDPSFKEDSSGEADFNFVIAKSGGIIEVQGGAEIRPVAWELFEQARLLAVDGAQQWFTFFDAQLEDVLPSAKEKKETSSHQSKSSSERVSLFSLKQRQQGSL